MGGNESINKPKCGVQVLQIQPNSPAQLAGLIPFFDFIVSSSGLIFDHDGPEFVELIRQSTDKEVCLNVYNTRTEQLREITIVPSNFSQQQTKSTSSPPITTETIQGFIGLSVRFSSFEHASELVWHVLSVQNDSPAFKAGLRNGGIDWIIGSPEVLFGDIDDLFLLINSSINQALPLFVYGKDTNEIRTISITPGLNGFLGCEIATGILHHLPSINQTSQPTQ